MRCMSIVKTHAIVLKSDNYRETSKLVTLFTKDFGKIKCLAKGVRDTKSKWGGVLLPMCCLNIVLYFNENKTLHLLSNAEHLKLYMDLYGNFEKTKIGYRMVELISRTSADQHPNPELFDLLMNSLDTLNSTPDSSAGHIGNIFIGFEFKLAQALGIKVDMDLLRKKYLTSSGSAYAEVVTENALLPNFVVADSVDSLKNWNFNLQRDIKLSRETLTFLNDFFEGYFDTHFDNLTFPKTKKVFSKS